MTPGVPDETSEVRSPLEVASQLGVSLDALAAVAAHLRVEAEDMKVDPAIRDLLKNVASEVLGISEPIGPAERQAIIGMVRAFIYQAEDLISHPGRAAGWLDTNETLLQGLGRLPPASSGPSMLPVRNARRSGKHCTVLTQFSSMSAPGPDGSRSRSPKHSQRCVSRALTSLLRP